MSGTIRAAMPFDCQRCGACCATYRVSFYWAEAELLGLPPELVQPLTPVLACLAGTNQVPPHCAALDGRIGATVACRAYAQRPSPCREVQPGDDKCRRARARHALDTQDRTPPTGSA
ncbi:MAG TPA: YkgJ family cysteine cluster protein [Burkholderiaceae bacterium]|nr:YkgJ family cysteine cluster protein [Burkholderiaceae bacterium]HMZ01370.1 YkgJ family cysteine cluster protein [Burkholderiaceae bacterium]HNB43233.1 YkgJ family cysteine cluster protein [Burkholderiaceae bacterium]HNG78478.1 YkgJ family cysteine cluster protein [Burkholderiaceae bacterium]